MIIIPPEGTVIRPNLSNVEVHMLLPMQSTTRYLDRVLEVASTTIDCSPVALTIVYEVASRGISSREV